MLESLLKQIRCWMKWNLLFINKAIIIVHTYDPEFCKIGRVFDSECYLVLRVAAYKWMNFKKVSKIYSSLPPIVSHLICHAFGNRRNIVLCDTHTRTHTQPHTHTHTDIQLGHQAVFRPIIWARYPFCSRWVESGRESVKPLVRNRIYSPHQF